MANGTIAFDTLSTSGQISGTAKSVDTDYVVSGAPKVFCTWITASSFTNQASLNISSLTDNGAGDCTLTYTSGFDGAKTYSNTVGTNGNGAAADITSTYANKTATTSRWTRFNASNSAEDASDCNMIACGDLA